ncbi:hypothetical protein V499_01543 [Pseudogymnoascus sp. VKM F-103]|nr:hypothetical protein V499_01543 [Pseudogymnoascus sp. VKM F-103]
MPPPPSFLCTFCWLPQYPPIHPKTLGTESRICCPPCYERILDLAICWVCGEVIVRTEEAVSLGWCFRHRHCFGRLICGEKLAVGDGRLELDVVPVCGDCEEGNEGVGREIDRRDGGLGKARWERLIEPKHGSVSNETLSGVAQTQVEVEAESRAKTGAAAESISYNGEHESPASPPPVYITITDPINGPSFKPSPTKPIPRWMKQLPNGREREQVHLPATTSSAAAESKVDIVPIENARDLLVPSLQLSAPEEQRLPSQITHAFTAATVVPEAILAYNDRRMTMSTPPKMHHQRPEYGARPGTPLYTGGEMGVEYLRRCHLRAMEKARG